MSPKLLVEAMRLAQENHCYLCSDPMGDDDVTVDHIWPRALRGRNDLPNLALAHVWCNQDKADRPPTLPEILMGWFLAFALEADFFHMPTQRRDRAYQHTDGPLESPLAAALRKAGIGGT